MHTVHKPRTTYRARAVRGLARAAALGVLVAVVPAGVAGAAQTRKPVDSKKHRKPVDSTKHHRWVVHPGESIQAAVDHARSGDTVKIEAGTYTEAVCVVHKGLKVVGAGRDRTTIAWPDWTSVGQLPNVGPAPCWTAQENADAEDDPTTLNDDVSGLFFLNPDSRVTVTGLGTRNHPANGIAVWGANGFDVHRTKGVGHERYGVLAADSTHVRITGNVERGVDRGAPRYSGTSGVSVGDSANARAYIAGNRVEGYNLGVFVRESRTGTITRNTVTGNCVGVLIFDDSATEIPDTTRHVDSGAWKVTANKSLANNRYCIAGRDESQRVSGVGMFVANADHVLVAGNTIRDNQPVIPAGGNPVTSPPGGLVLLSLASPPGTNPPGAVDPGLVEHVKVVGNTIRNNIPVDIWLTRPIPGTLVREPGPGIVFRDNNCATSDPANICGSPTEKNKPTVRPSPRSVRASARYRVTFRLRCPRDERSCQLNVRLRRGKSTIASSKTVRARGGQTVRVPLALNKSVRNYLHTHPRLKALGFTTARDSAGNVGRTTVKITVLRPA